MKIPFISKKCLKHSNRGTFSRRNGRYKMLSGGHGQDNINYLNKKKIDNNVTKEYNNGVRLGNVSIHRREKYRTKSAQCWFPKNWKEKDIKKAGRYVMSLKKNKKRTDGIAHTGTYKGVKVGVYTNNGYIKTVYPWYIQKGGEKYDNR